MKTINKEIEVFISEDGKEFINKDECSKYENTTLKMENDIKYFRYYTNMDLNETGMFYNCNYAAVYIKGFDDCYYEVMLQYLVDKHKGRVIHENVQGYGVAKMFSISSCTKAEYFKAEPKKWGGHNTETEKILLSETPIDGFPDNIPVMSKHFKYK